MVDTQYTRLDDTAVYSASACDHRACLYCSVLYTVFESKTAVSVLVLVLILTIKNGRQSVNTVIKTLRKLLLFQHRPSDNLTLVHYPSSLSGAKRNVLFYSGG